MKTRACRVALAVVLSAGTLVAQGLNVRTGAWEITMTMGGVMSMEGVPPEARAQIEAELRKPQVVKNCVTPEDVKQLNLGKTEDGEDENCKVLSSKITPTSADITRQCSGDQAYTETAHFEAPTPQTMTANISRKSAEGATTIKMTGKWVAAACSE
ncbi:MAG: DUF3617 domain-containing protein [Candidatus Korobacteraceae bacterium]